MTGYGRGTVHVALWKTYDGDENKMEGEIDRWQGTFTCSKPDWQW